MVLKDKIKEENFKEWMLKWSNKKFKNTMFLTGPVYFGFFQKVSRLSQTQYFVITF